MIVDRLAREYAARRHISIRETVLSITESAETAALYHRTDRVIAYARSEHGGWWVINPDLISPNDLRVALRMCCIPVEQWNQPTPSR